MTFSDFFSTSFLFSIVIIIILTGSIFAYVNYKMAEQDHKLTSMVSLVSILANDLQFVKNKVNIQQTYVDPNILQYQSQMIGGEHTSGLISVSDGEDDDNDDDDEIDQDDDDNDDDEIDQDDDDDNDDDNEDEDDDNIEDTQEHIKLLNLTLANDNIEHDLIVEELNTEELNADDTSNIVDIKTIHIDNYNDNEDIEYTTSIENEQTNTNLTNEEFSFLKNVSITDLGDNQDFLTSKSEYKKLPINKLREVVVSKGIVTDASKLKKQEILKLLGDE